VQFAVGNLDDLHVDGTFDVIIYNESLYYMRNPQQAIKALFKNLAPGGVFIVSMVDKHGKERIGLWTDLDEILTVVEKAKVSNMAGDSWTVRVYKKS
jgi:2-polyprenyl-3-methyl-5-hydroxy-6-metoxy-1,4-benzoquinol methylase